MGGMRGEGEGEVVHVLVRVADEEEEGVQVRGDEGDVGGERRERLLVLCVLRERAEALQEEEQEELAQVGREEQLRSARTMDGLRVDAEERLKVTER